MVNQFYSVHFMNYLAGYGLKYLVAEICLSRNSSINVPFRTILTGIISFVYIFNAYFYIFRKIFFIHSTYQQNARLAGRQDMHSAGQVICPNKSGLISFPMHFFRRTGLCSNLFLKISDCFYFCTRFSLYIFLIT